MQIQSLGPSSLLAYLLRLNIGHHSRKKYSFSLNCHCKCFLNICGFNLKPYNFQEMFRPTYYLRNCQLHEYFMIEFYQDKN